MVSWPSHCILRWPSIRSISLSRSHRLSVPLHLAPASWTSCTRRCYSQGPQDEEKDLDTANYWVQGETRNEVAASNEISPQQSKRQAAARQERSLKRRTNLQRARNKSSPVPAPRTPINTPVKPTPDIRFPLPRGRPYSIPEPELYRRMSRVDVRNRIRGKSNDEISRVTWFADRAGPPLLLTLDAFDTLYTPKEPVARQYAEIASRFGYPATEEQIQAEFKKALQAVSTEFPNQGRGKIHYNEWWAKVIEQTFEPFKVFRRPWPDSDLTQRLIENFASYRGYKLFDDVEDLLALVGTSWQAKNWPPKRTMLGIVSNSDPRLRNILKSFDIDIQDAARPQLYPPRYAPETRVEPQFGPAGFSFATLSYECGIEKPSEDIYTQAIADAQRILDNADPFQRLTRSGKSLLGDVRRQFAYLHVGDSLEKDVLPALRCGWDAILLDRSATEAVGEREVEGLGAKVTVINRLTCIKDVITKERLQSRLDKRLGTVKVPEDEDSTAADPLDNLAEIRRKRREAQSARDSRPRSPSKMDTFRSLDLRGSEANSERIQKTRTGDTPSDEQEQASSGHERTGSE